MHLEIRNKQGNYVCDLHGHVAENFLKEFNDILLDETKDLNGKGCTPVKVVTESTNFTFCNNFGGIVITMLEGHYIKNVW